ncbi:MAG: zinc/iron-chelating domain-containing protein [Bacteroidetes bacterium 4572_77]|nr:MAG: zinc/iron-chelating domain-containing protein [Bacteroidetes bacterium 4572_77]
MDLEKHEIKAKDALKANKKLLQQIKKKKPKNLDAVVHELHDDAFEQIDCLECANCCKSISPIVTDKDIQRIAKKLRMKPSAFVAEFLNLDSENDYVFKKQPCPFLGEDNYCSIYEARPKACAEYPHTDRRKFIQLLPLSLKNTVICPAVLQVFVGLEEEYNR